MKKFDIVWRPNPKGRTQFRIPALGGSSPEDVVATARKAGLITPSGVVVSVTETTLRPLDFHAVVSGKESMPAWGTRGT